MLELKNIEKIYRNEKKESIGVQDITLTLPDKGLVFIMGESGSGKTTLLNVMSGLDACTKGSIVLNDKDITVSKEKEWETLRNKHIGIVFQGYNLIQDMTIEDNLALPLKILDIPQNNIYEEVEEVLKYVGLEEYGKRKPYELSAGQKQRVAIARGIIKHPEIVLADEPTGNLDPKNSNMIFKILEDISKNCLVVVITHNEDAAYKYGDRIIKISHGKIVEDVNNKYIKKIAAKKYMVTISNSENQDVSEKVMAIDSLDLKNEILNICCEKDDSNELVIKEDEISLQFKMKPIEDEERERIDEWDRGYNTKRLPVCEKLKYTFLNMKFRKFRLFITMVLFAFSGVLIMIFNQIQNNDYMKSLDVYMEEKDERYIVPYKQYEDSDELIPDKYIGQIIYGELDDIVGKDNIIKVMGDLRIETGKDEDGYAFCRDSIIVMENRELFETLSVSGRLPEKSNEIALNIETVKGLELGENAIGSKVFLNGNIFTVVGVVQETFMFDEYYSIVDISYINEICSNAQNIVAVGTDITSAYAISMYAQLECGIGKINLAKENADFVVFYGRMPKDANEIIISRSYAEKLGYSEDENGVVNDNFPTEFRIKNLYSSKYEGKYIDSINLFDYMRRDIKVVGIYDYNYDNYNSSIDILLDDSVFENVLKQYNEYFIYNKYIVYLGNGLDTEYSYEKLNMLTECGYRFISPISENMYSFMEFVDEFGKEMIFLIVGICVVTLFMMISYISFNIRDNAHKIGIFRAIGMSERDIIGMFIYESIIICLLSAIIMNGIFIGFVEFFNGKVVKVLNVSSYRLLIPEMGHIILISGAVVIVGVLLTILPILQLMKKKSITLINNNPEGGMS